MKKRLECIKVILRYSQKEDGIGKSKIRTFINLFIKDVNFYIGLLLDIKYYK